ncbi:MAG: hypothetical protein ABIN97_01625 [Ginsengibacter sp.]
MESFNEEELAVIAKEYPYYSPAQFRLLSMYKKNQHKNFDEQASLTALFFNNIKWLNWQLFYHNKLEDNHIDNVVSVAPGSQIHSEQTQELTKVPTNKNEEVIAFEPLHTIDYFASQGIKINEETLTNDKLGTQLKSFTEWLKSMKKIHSDKMPQGDEQTDKIIQHIAESSNEEVNVVTEAMAEVLQSQGKIKQAIEMYNKLSLNYPSQSAYFADKIHSLKSV